jgi:hypothetical protein
VYPRRQTGNFTLAGDHQPRNPMSKTKDSKSQTKKTALKTPQQKREAKRDKKARRTR